MDAGKQAIVEAAIVVFGKYGFKQTTMNMIAEQAGLSRQSVYNHFSDKETILRAMSEYVHETAFERGDGVVQQALAESWDPVTAMCRLLEVRLEVFMSSLGNSPHFEELVSEHSKYCALQNSEQVERFRKSMAKFLSELMKKNDLSFVRGVNAEELALVLSESIHGLKTAGHPPKEFSKRSLLLTRLLVGGAIDR